MNAALATHRRIVEAAQQERAAVILSFNLQEPTMPVPNLHECESFAHSALRLSRRNCHPRAVDRLARAYRTSYERATTRVLEVGATVWVVWQVWWRKNCLAVRRARVIRVVGDSVWVQIAGVIRVVERVRVRLQC